MVIIQLLLLTILLPLAYGPVGHAALSSGGPNLLIICLWQFAWLTDRRSALSWAILAGLSADLLSFHRFGIVTLVFIAAALLITYLRNRFFQVSSLIEALSTLVVVSILYLVVEAITARQFFLNQFIVSIIANVVIGAVTYYVLAIRFRLFQRWSGQRL